MKYIGIKFVEAALMPADVAKDKGYRVGDNTGYGYEVTYDDGYKSWCPEDVFNKHNFIVKNEVLAKSCQGMVSNDYRERFKTEYIQLKNRLDGLKKMLDAWSDGKLSFKPAAPRNLYESQKIGMELYLRALVHRAKLELIDLPDIK
jgi:hypothetical protein